MEETEKDIREALVSILSRQTLNSICSKLDSHKILLSENKYHRDWRGLAQHVDLEVSQIRSIKISPTEHCLQMWVEKDLRINDYWNCLVEMDRYDVIDDNYKAICEDFNNSKNGSFRPLKQLKIPLENIQNSIDIHDTNILTIDDANNIKNGGNLQFYNALVLYEDNDNAFVQEMVFKLENEHGMKICLIDRELIGGVLFEFEAVARLIRERCQRVIVVISPSFLASKTNNFFIAFAQALSIDQRRRIVIPCMLEPCRKPPVIEFSHSLDHYRHKGYWNYWDKLAASVKPTPDELKSKIVNQHQFPLKSIEPQWISPLALNSKDMLAPALDTFESKSSKCDSAPTLYSGGVLSLPEVPSPQLDSFSTNSSTTPLVLGQKEAKSGFRKKLKKLFNSKKKANMTEG